MKVLPETIDTPYGPSVENASPDLLRALLEELERQLELKGIPTHKYFRDPASEARVIETFARQGVIAPEEAIVWFGWHDGVTKIEHSRDVLPKFMFESLADSEFRRRGVPLGTGEFEWDPHWFQIMGDNNGLAVYCDDDASTPPLVRSLNIAEWNTEPGNTQRQVVSLCTPVTWWIDAIRHGWYVWYPDKQRWDADPMPQPIARSGRAMS